MSAVGVIVTSMGVGAAAPASAARTIVVQPGESIQAAVNRANSGDRIVIKPGHYRESVLITKSGLRIQGSGAGPNGTVVEPGRPDRRNPCSVEAGGNGFCVIGSPRRTVHNTRISNLLVRNFGGSGVVSFGADGFFVDNVHARNNHEYGITAFASTRVVFVRNKASGSEDAGIYIGDSPNARAFVAGNELHDNNLGILFRHARNAAFSFNLMRDNCTGFLAVSAPPRPATGQAAVTSNTVKNNNRACPAHGEAPPFQCGGIVLIGPTDMLIGPNAVLGNRGPTPLSGGIVLLNGSMFGAGPSTRNLIRNNTAFRNAPADIIDRSGGRNSFVRNTCGQSVPRRICD